MSFLDDLKSKISGGGDKSKPLISTVATQYEINLVPAVKMQMIKAQKLRNLVLFVCILVSAASVGAVIVLFGIKSGQDIAMANQDGKLETLSAKLMGYEELGDMVTIQSQLEKLAQIQGNKKVLSRVFGAMNVMLPQGGDSVQLSDLRVDFSSNEIRMEGQADARVAPLIDYRVLESFKKGAALTKYDYGNYVDMEGNVIPTWCVSESNADGSAYRMGESYYAWWSLLGEDCAARREGGEARDDEEVRLVYSKDAEVEIVEEEVERETLESEGVEIEEKEDGEIVVNDEDIEVRDRGNGEKYFVRKKVERVKIWRTPQFDKWYSAGLMNESGEITEIEHFESACTTYSGTVQSGSSDKDKYRWTSDNTCMLAPDGLEVLASSNGRDASDNLVLRFSASMNIAPEFFAFGNKHMVAIGPMGQNVTDSYVQIEGMFTEEARACQVGDTECLSNANNTGGER